MSHLFDSGLSVRDPAWHQLTNVLATAPKTWKAARKAAGIDTWEVGEGPVFGFELAGIGGERVFDPRALILDDEAQRKMAAQVATHIRNGKMMDALAAMGAVLIDDKKRTLRTDSGDTFGIPTIEYEVISLDEIGEICDALIKALATPGSKPKVTIEALVSLEGGKSIVATLLLDEPVTLPGDKSVTLPLLVVSSRNDGAGAARAQTSTIRVICANTRAMSDNQADKNGTVFTFKHGASWRDRLEEARQTLLGLRKEFAENMDFFKELARIKVTPQQELDWLGEFIPIPVTAAELSDRQIANRMEARQQVMAILGSDTCKGVRGKAYGLLAAGDEFLDFYRNVDTEGRLRNPTLATKRSLLLQPDREKLRSVQIIRSVVGLKPA